jgi:hypothetical protein
MNVTKTDWQPGKYGSNTNDMRIYAEKFEHSPCFSFMVGFNEPDKPWKPYFVIDLWNIHITFGWLLGGPIEKK